MNSRKFIGKYQFSIMNLSLNFLVIDFRQIDQNLRNSGKVVPQRFAFNKNTYNI